MTPAVKLLEKNKISFQNGNISSRAGQTVRRGGKEKAVTSMLMIRLNGELMLVPLPAGIFGI